MDEFEAAGFDEETCEQLRKISEESGVAPCHIISAIRGCQTDNTELLQFCSAWYRFRMALWNEFSKSKIGKFMIRLADKLAAILERSEGE